MDWVAVTLLGTVLFALVAVLDKRLISTYMPSVNTFYVMTGLPQGVIAAVTLLLVPWQGGVPGRVVVVALVSGFLWGMSLTLLFYGFRKLEVSRAIPLFHTFPVVVALLAMVVLDNRLSVGQWSGILLTVAGVGLIGANRTEGARHRNPILPQLIVLLGGVFMAVSYVTYKYALDDINFWNLFALRTGCVGLVLVLFGLRSNTVSEVRRVWHDRRALHLFVYTEVLLASFAAFLSVVALALGPVSLVSTLMSTRPMFVLLISGLLSTQRLHLLDEPFTRDTLPTKLAFTAVIVTGVSLLGLS